MGEKKGGFFQRHGNRVVAFLICLAIVGGCCGALLRHYQRGGGDDLIGEMENRLLDLRFLLRGPRQPTGKIGILAIDEKSLQQFGRWPISRKYYEQAFHNLKKLGVNWLGFDVVWSMPEKPLLEDVAPSLSRLDKITGPNWHKRLQTELGHINQARTASPADQAMARALQDYGKVVLGFFYYASASEAEALGANRYAGFAPMADSAIQAVVMPDGKELKDYPALKSHGIVANTPFIGTHAKHFAFFNNESDPDAIMRWVTLVREVNGTLMPSLSFAMAAAILGREPVVFFDNYGITDISLVNPDNDQDILKVPVDADGYGRILINHLGPGGTIPHFSLADAWSGSFTPAQKQALKGMNLLLGPTAIAINDQRANPFDAGINGVENHAAAIDNILSGHFMRRSGSIYLTELAVVLAIGLVFAPIMVFGRAVFSGAAALLFLVGYYYFDKYFWFSQGQWVYMGMPFIEIASLFISTTLYKYMTEERERRKVKGAFSLYLAPEVIDQVLDDPEALMRGEKKELTVFFSDVRSFTTISEGLTPEKLRELMNEYLTPMTDLILQSKGVLDKYIGDAIMAFWGAPVSLPNHVDVACATALQMLVVLDKLRQDFPKKGFPVIDVGIGLNTGVMSVGNMGSPRRAAYTVMGDAVNLGSRLESLTKEYGIKIMISEFTRRLITRTDLSTRDLDDIRVKGKLEPVKVFELVRPDLLGTDAAVANLIGEFELGRLAYGKQDWPAAKRHFMSCLMLRPDDKPAALYLERIGERERQPALADWDGVYTFTHK